VGCGVGCRQAQIWHCCGCGIGQAAIVLIQPLAWAPPYAAGAALKSHTKKKKKRKKKEKEVHCSRVKINLSGQEWKTSFKSSTNSHGLVIPTCKDPEINSGQRNY